MRNKSNRLKEVFDWMANVDDFSSNGNKDEFECNLS